MKTKDIRWMRILKTDYRAMSITEAEDFLLAILGELLDVKVYEGYKRRRLRKLAKKVAAYHSLDY